MPRTSFRADVNGFAFINCWQFDETEKVQIRAIFQGAISAAQTLSMFLPFNPLVWLILGDVRSQLATWASQAQVEAYGLCGGMAFAALDYYYHPDLTFPRGTGPDNQPTPDTPPGGNSGGLSVTKLRLKMWFSPRMVALS